MRLCALEKCFGLALAAAFCASPGAWADCEPWPGEPNPLPTAGSADGLTARFANLRAHELAALALELESSAPGDAYKVWLHVTCLDPERDDAREGAKRTVPLRIHHPEVVNEPVEVTMPARAPDLASAFGELDNPISVGLSTRAAKPAVRAAAKPHVRVSQARQPRRVARQAAPRDVPLEADGLLDEAEGLVRQAHFEEALEKAAKAREALPQSGDQAALRQRRARADMIAGTAQVALGEDADARASFERALQTDPSLRLDRTSTSPKVLRAFDAARQAAGGGTQ
jgi:hypothetical protein